MTQISDRHALLQRRARRVTVQRGARARTPRCSSSRRGAGALRRGDVCRPSGRRPPPPTPQEGRAARHLPGAVPRAWQLRRVLGAPHLLARAVRGQVPPGLRARDSARLEQPRPQDHWRAGRVVPCQCPVPVLLLQRCARTLGVCGEGGGGATRRAPTRAHRPLPNTPTPIHPDRPEDGQGLRRRGRPGRGRGRSCPAAATAAAAARRAAARRAAYVDDAGGFKQQLMDMLPSLEHVIVDVAHVIRRYGETLTPHHSAFGA